MNRIRREKIRQFIHEKEMASITELRAICPDISLMTLHRDLDALEQGGHITKMRGGARAVNHSLDPRFEVRAMQYNAEKETIAQKALCLIRPGSTVFFDAGTTNLAIARLLPDMDLTVFTTAPCIAVELARLHHPSINVCGGNLNRANQALSGQNTLEMLDKINIDLAFIGASGYSADTGFTCGKESEMLVKRLVIAKARSAVIPFDLSKLSRLMPFTFATLAEVDSVITDKSPPADFALAAKKDNTSIY